MMRINRGIFRDAAARTRTLAVGALLAALLPGINMNISLAQSAALDAIDDRSAQGTGGVGVEAPSGHWPAARAELPKVKVTANGLEIVAGGRLLTVPSGNPAADRFLLLWWDLHNPQNGYFSRDNIPFHSAETLIVEAPDFGHLTTSETMSYWALLEANFGRYSGDFSLLRYALDQVERYMIPNFQPSAQAYGPSSPAQFAPEEDTPNAYPVPLDPGARPGLDPLAAELKGAYGDQVYGMHWLLDTTNWYGYGSGQEPVFINTFQRGPMESVWKTVPHPSVEDFRFGASGQGFLSLFTRDYSGYKRQWRYTNAPDADARLIQAVYWAKVFAGQKGDARGLSDLTARAAKMGDFLRYALFDKYFKRIGCQSPNCEAGQGYDAAHYLLSWYYSWGGSHPADQGAWAWRIGSSHAHFGYQNPLAAYALAEDPELRPKTAHATADWRQSLDRQIEFYRWLQASEGGIAGGATSSYKGRYGEYPTGTPTFHGLAYVEHPVYLDPPSNTWFGFQTWSLERVAEYYEQSGDPRAEDLLDRWVAWAMTNTRVLANGDFQIPSQLRWLGAPETWDPQHPRPNANLHVEVATWDDDVGIAASLARTLAHYAAATLRHRSQDGAATKEAQGAQSLARQIVDLMWKNHRDSKGYTSLEVRKDYNQFNAPVYVPSGYHGTMPSGALIDEHATFLSLRPQYRQEPNFDKITAYLQGGAAPRLHYHRFWTEVEVAVAFAEADQLLNSGK